MNEFRLSVAVVALIAGVGVAAAAQSGGASSSAASQTPPAAQASPVTNAAPPAPVKKKIHHKSKSLGTPPAPHDPAGSGDNGDNNTPSTH
jgi:hypothetical protein